MEVHGGAVAVEEGEATEGGGRDEGGDMEVEADQEDEHGSVKVLNVGHKTSDLNNEEELIEPGVEEGDGGDTGEGEASQLEIVLERGEDANAAMPGD